METLGRWFHYMHSLFLPERHRRFALIEIDTFEHNVDALYTYMNTWYPYFLHDLEIRSCMVRHHGSVIKYFPDLQEIRLFVLDAVRNDGLALQYCLAFQDDWEVVFEAIGQNGYAYRYAAKDIQNDIDIMCHALISAPAMLMDLAITDVEYRCTILAITRLKASMGSEALFGCSERVQRLATSIYKHSDTHVNDVD